MLMLSSGDLTFQECQTIYIQVRINILPVLISVQTVWIVSYKIKYVHELLVNRLFKPAQEKVWLGELTVPQWP